MRTTMGTCAVRSSVALPHSSLALTLVLLAAAVVLWKLIVLTVPYPVTGRGGPRTVFPATSRLRTSVQCGGAFIGPKSNCPTYRRRCRMSIGGSGAGLNVNPKTDGRSAAAQLLQEARNASVARG